MYTCRWLFLWASIINIQFNIVCSSSSCWPSINQRLPYSQKTVTSHTDTYILSQVMNVYIVNIMCELFVLSLLRRVLRYQTGAKRPKIAGQKIILQRTKRLMILSNANRGWTLMLRKGKHWCSGRVNRFCYTCRTLCITLVKPPLLLHERQTRIFRVLCCSMFGFICNVLKNIVCLYLYHYWESN